MVSEGVLGHFVTVDGTELVLHHRNSIYTIRVNGHELMTSHAHGSEEALARLGCGHLADLRGARVLIGGLGMGYTLRAVLEILPSSATAVVAEVFPAVVTWCRGPLADLAGDPLADRRVKIVESNVIALLEREKTSYDAILLDVDNGPHALTLISNRRLYIDSGLALIRARLAEDGVLAVWSAWPDKAFVRRLRKCGFEVRAKTVSAREHGDSPDHTIFVARVGDEGWESMMNAE
jgi:spermidine synthase